MTGYPTTLVEALDRLPGSANADGSLRGFRFLTTDREDRFYPYADLRAEAHRRAAILASHGLAKGDTVALDARTRTTAAFKGEKDEDDKAKAPPPKAGPPGK